MNDTFMCLILEYISYLYYILEQHKWPISIPYYGTEGVIWIDLIKTESAKWI